ncbi:hypothetical protein TcasGA2_TC007237 [Tribolium castaneum]|uniref:Uncharacterized protein n=1 Tax=Tribolium castaneum TaxID=7070 RepID=D2A0M1_TRICA|nr:hypothetical protein TcasGA2_TC007237 [Tribolium castaneum]
MKFHISVALLAIILLISEISAKPAPNFVFGIPGAYFGWWNWGYYPYTHVAYAYPDDGVKVTWSSWVI